MKILAVSDVESRKYYDFYKPGSLDDYDLIISCGDLHRQYLEFLATMAHCPVMYVHGNHDEDYRLHPPGGCVCLDDKLVTYKGVRILGLGGSFRYKNDATYMFTEKEMKNRLRHQRVALMISKGVDILVAHAPAYQHNDEDNVSHRGFDTFNEIIERYQPGYFLHGHIHMSYGKSVPRFSRKGNTQVINAYDNVKLNMPEFDMKGRTDFFLKRAMQEGQNHR